MKLAHTRDDRLAGFLIGMLAEGGILLRKLRQSFGHLGLSCLCPGFDRQLDNRFRELHGLKDHRVALIADGVAGRGELQADRRSDVARVDLLQLGTLVGVHLQDAAEALLFILRGIQDIRAGVGYA